MSVSGWRIASMAVFSVSMVSTPVWADEHVIQAQQVFQQLSAQNIVRAQFEQTKQLASVNKSFKSTGQILFSKTHGVLWQIKRPVQADLVMSPKKIVQKTARTQSVINLEQSPYGAVANVFLQLMTGDIKTLQQNFNIDSVQFGQNTKPGTWQIRLSPKAPMLKKLFNAVEASGGEYVQRMVIHDKGQTMTTIQFTQHSQQPSTLNATEHALYQLAK